MADPVLSVLLPLPLLLASGTVAAGLARSALRHWWAQRAGQAYELPAAYLGAGQRALGAVAAAAVAVIAAVPVIGAMPLITGEPGDRPRSAPAAAPSPSSAPVPVPSRAAHEPRTVPRTIGHPAGGTLTRLTDGTRVWLPPQYAYPGADDLAFPVVVVHARPDDPDLFPAFTAHTARGLADPFILVLPAASCPADPGPLLATLARHYRTVPGRPARAVLGIGPRHAACAVRHALAHPGRYHAAVGVSGTYGPYAATLGRPELLLAAPSDETAARASALRLHEALRSPAGPEIRVLDGVSDRRQLLTLVSAYLTEKLDGPRESPLSG